MNVWANTVLTEKGHALLAKLTQGNTLDIVDAVAGAGYVTPGLLIMQTDVTDPMQQLKARPVAYPESGRCDLPLVMTNDGLESGYLAKQLGVYANDPDEGRILFFIAQSAEPTKGTEVPSETEMPGFCAEWTFQLQYSQADSVNVTVDPANTVSPAELRQFMFDNFIPLTRNEIYMAAELAGVDDYEEFDKTDLDALVDTVLAAVDVNIPTGSIGYEVVPIE